MNLIKLLLSAVGRVAAAVTGPLRMTFTRAMRLFNINTISAKLIQPLTKAARGMLGTRPRAREDYFVVGKLWVYKKLLTFFGLALCAGVLAYFTMSAPPAAATAPAESQAPGGAAARAGVTYDYNDRELRDFTGVANVRAQSGEIVYTGQIEAGAVTGAGTLYSRYGELVYEGEFSRNRYEGMGVAYYPGGVKKYEGEFVRGRYQGQGTLYTTRGGVLYEGAFRDGLYDGEGRLFGESGALLYEGAFKAGERHGTGVAYHENGTVRYSGEFFRDRMQGVGALCDGGGRPVYTGRMYGGGIDFASFPGMTLADMEAAFPETPLLYCAQERCCFVFQNAGVAVSSPCRVREDAETLREPAPAGPGYYLPGEGAQDRQSPPAGWTRLSATGMSWSLEGEASSSASSSEAPAPGTLFPTPSAPSSSSSSEEDELADILRELLELQKAQAAAAQEQPEFVDSERTLYFEVDRGVWQEQAKLDKSMVLIDAVAVFGEVPAAPEGAKPLAEGGAPGLEDCVAIDFLRARQPAAFPDVTFEADRRSRLRVWVRAINGTVDRRRWTENGATFDLCAAYGEGGAGARYLIVRK